MIDPASRFAYISNIYGGNVSVIDIEAQKVVATIPSGAGPNGISFSPIAPATADSPEMEIAMPDRMDRMEMGG